MSRLVADAVSTGIAGGALGGRFACAGSYIHRYQAAAPNAPARTSGINKPYFMFGLTSADWLWVRQHRTSRAGPDYPALKRSCFTKTGGADVRCHDENR